MKVTSLGRVYLTADSTSHGPINRSLKVLKKTGLTEVGRDTFRWRQSELEIFLV